MTDTTPDQDMLNSFTATGITPALDPMLQYLAAKRSVGELPVATASTGTDEVAVIARVADSDLWENLSEVRAGLAIGEADDGTSIVTGRIPTTRVEHVRNQDFVLSLKAARPLFPSLSDGIAEARADPGSMPGGALSAGGRGVVVGVVDYDCDFAHRNFLNAAGKTRILAIWDQGGNTLPGSPLGYGREYTADEINAALSQPDPYAALGYGPAPDNAVSRGSHGTHVMDICAGSGGGSGVPGFAPNAEIVFVDASHDDLVFDGPEAVGTSFGDSTRLLEAIAYIFDKAGDRPCVINVSLGTNGGPHDGSTLVEQGIDRLLRAAPNRAVTIAASNSFEDGIHAAGSVAADDHVDLQWNIKPNPSLGHELEVWYSGAERISLELIMPDGHSLGVVEPGENGGVTSNGRIVVYAANRLADPNNADNMIGLFIDSSVPQGIWTLRLRGEQIEEGRFHAWIERNNAGQTAFMPPHDNTHTIGSISCGHLALAVASYDAHKDQRPLSWFSSAGPTRDGREKPEISAPGHAVLAAHSRTGVGVIPKSGTSMAAPALAGIIALVLEEANARGRKLEAEEIREIVIASARSDPPAGSGWDDRYGYGRVDAADAVARAIEIASGGPALVAALPGGRTDQPHAPQRASSKGKSRKKA